MTVDINWGQRKVLALVTAHVLDDDEAAQAAERDIDIDDPEDCAEVIYGAVDLLAQAIVTTSIMGCGADPEEFLGRLGASLAAGSSP